MRSHQAVRFSYRERRPAGFRFAASLSLPSGNIDTATRIGKDPAMSDPLDIRAIGPWKAAIGAIHDLLTRLKMDHMFVGTVAESAWLGDDVVGGPVDVLAALAPERKGQIPMMAGNRGFIVDRDAVEAAAELDIVPLAWETDGVRVRVHVLLASNALYGRMFRTPAAARMDEMEMQVPSAEDVVLMMIVGDRDRAEIERVAMAAAPRFDRDALNTKLVSVGLPGGVI